MKMFQYIKQALVGAACIGMAVNAMAGFSVQGTQLKDGNGNNFVMRGVNHPHAWYTSRTSSIADIGATGANTVRIVLANGDQWTRTTGSEITNLINLCKSAKLVCVLEVHDATGYGESSGAGTVASAAQFWVDNANLLKGQENYVIINIANEPFGNNQGVAAWRDSHIAAIQRLRNAGLTHTIMVDAPSWGQDWDNTMLNNAQTVFAADNRANTVFSVHMYEVYQNYSRVNDYVTSFLAKNLPLVIGEFGPSNNGSYVDADSIMAVAQAKGVGYLGWSWSGNGSCCYALDMVNNFNAGSLTNWGDRLINGANGIKATSVRATVYGGSGASSSSVSSSASSKQSSSVSSSSSANSGARQCNWYGSIHPICSSTTSGWGWENSQSCISYDTCAFGGGSVVGSSSSQVSSSSSSVRSSSSSSVATQCNWYGSRYPVCTNSDNGWGWENNQSCVGRTSCASVGGL